MAEILKGNLSQISVIDLLFLLNKTKHSGRLSLETNKEQGFVFLDQGEIYAAWLGEKKGYEALLNLVALNEGIFSFQNGVRTSERQFNEDTKGILEKVKAQIQTAVSAKAFQNKVLYLIPREQRVTLNPQEWAVVALSQRQLTLSEVAKRIRVSINQVVIIADKLVKQGLAKLKDKEKIITPGKPQQYIPLLFWKTLKNELAKLIGPIAEAVIEDEIKNLGDTKDKFPYDKISTLIEHISQEIDDPREKIVFQKKMVEILKRI